MTMYRCLLAFIVGLSFVAGPAFAQGVIVDKSEIRFVAKQLGVNVEGRFPKWKADVVFLPADLPHSKAVFDIELAGIDLASEDSEKEIRDRLWFDTAKFPIAHFASTAITARGGDRYEIAGDLSLKGIVRPVVVPVVVRKDGAGNTVAEGSFTLKRLEFKIGEGLWADTDTVANEVTVRIRMTLPAAK